LMIRALERSDATGDDRLRGELRKEVDQRDVARMIQILRELGVEQEAEAEAARLEGSAFVALDAIAVDEERKRPLRELARVLQQRKS